MTKKEFQKRVKALGKQTNTVCVFEHNEAQNHASYTMTNENGESVVLKFWNNVHSDAVYMQFKDGLPGRAPGLEVPAQEEWVAKVKNERKKNPRKTVLQALQTRRSK